MAVFMHLTAEKNIESIRRIGIRPEAIHSSEFSKGIFCMPVIKDYYVIHQWARELMRFGLRNPCAVCFRVPDNEIVWFGRYCDHSMKATAVQAVDTFTKSKDRMGFQVILPRKVLSKEILRIYPVTPLGWRFYPGSKGKRPCLCPACIGRGEYGSHRMLVQKLDKHYHAFCHAEDTTEKYTALQELAELIDNHRLKFESWQELMRKETLSDPRLFEEVGRIIVALRNKKGLQMLYAYLEKHPLKTQEAFIWQILWGFMEEGEALLAPIRHLPIVIEQIKEFHSF